MQATTIETFVVGAVLEVAVRGDCSRRAARRSELGRLWASGPLRRSPSGLGDFAPASLGRQGAVPALARLTELESRTYAAGRFSTYFAGDGLITVFIDGTERSPTFRLSRSTPSTSRGRRCWFQVWAAAPDREAPGRPSSAVRSAGSTRRSTGALRDRRSTTHTCAAALESLKGRATTRRTSMISRSPRPHREGRGPPPRATSASRRPRQTRQPGSNDPIPTSALRGRSRRQGAPRRSSSWRRTAPR